MVNEKRWLEQLWMGRSRRSERGVVARVCEVFRTLSLAIAYTAVMVSSDHVAAMADERAPGREPIDGLTATLTKQASQIELLTRALAQQSLEIAAQARKIHEIHTDSFNCIYEVGHDVFIEGCNLHIRDGTGRTYNEVSEPNGLGNLIVGYDEAGTNEMGLAETKTGSHNLVVGGEHSYYGVGGFVAGRKNRIGQQGATVTGGFSNAAFGDYSSVAAGMGNLTTKLGSAVAGGFENFADGDFSSVSGGWGNRTTGNASWVGGGLSNEATEDLTSICGGDGNQATLPFEVLP